MILEMALVCPTNGVWDNVPGAAKIQKVNVLANSAAVAMSRIDIVLNFIPPPTRVIKHSIHSYKYS